MRGRYNDASSIDVKVRVFWCAKHHPKKPKAMPRATRPAAASGARRPAAEEEAAPAPPKRLRAAVACPADEEDGESPYAYPAATAAEIEHWRGRGSRRHRPPAVAGAECPPP
jgi:hypothetical protein